MNLFYAPDIDNELYVLNEQESKHCVKVLRKTEGDKLWLVDGKGGFYTVEIMSANPKKCQVRVVEKKTEYEKRNYFLHIGIAPTKNIDRFKWFLEKATEIGVDEITPIESYHSERRNLNIEKLELTITAAMKQSVKAYHPKLNALTKFNDFVLSNKNSHAYIAHCNEGEKSPLQHNYKNGEKAVILIGPEGDFSIEEVELAKNNGFKEITLGNSRLRTETAGIVACHTINFLNF